MHKFVNIPNCQDEGHNKNKSDNNSWNVEVQREDRTAFGKNTWRLLGVSLIAVLVPIVFPLLHIFIFLELWGHLNNPVDQKSCTCSCWDTVFKGPYETGIAKYKHVYFNSTWQTFKMWTTTVLGVVILYECFKTIIRLTLIRKLRLTMAILFLSSLHSHYYAWWGHWNYWNDDFYELWNHQCFYTVSELLSSALVVRYLDRRKPLQPLPLLIIANISLFHILSSGWDQFYFTVLKGQGHLHQVLRDVILMSTDLIHTGVTLYELSRYGRTKGLSLTTILSQRKHAASIFCTTSFMYLMVIFFP